MNRRLRTRLFATIALIALLGGGTLAAVTAARTSGGHTRHGRLAPDAAYLGLSEAQLQSQLSSGRSLAQIAEATSGKSKAGLIEAVVAARKAHLSELAAGLKERVTAQVERAGGPGAPASPANTAARYLGLSGAQLRARLRSGMTLARIADATPGRSQAGLIEALLARRRQALAAKVAAGKLTSAQEHRRLAHLTSRVSAMVNRVHLAGAGAATRHARLLEAPGAAPTG